MNRGELNINETAFFKHIQYSESALNVVKSEYTLLLYCYSGSAVIEINYRKYNITPHTTIHLTYQDILMRVYVSTDFKGYCIAFSPGLLMAEFNKFDFNFISALKKNCVISWDEQYASYIEQLFKTVTSCNEFDDEELIKATILNQYVCYIKLLKHYFQKNNLMDDKENEVISSKKEYFYSFVRELFNHHRRSREVLFYANTLNISSNYLNEICQSVCEHSAKEVIDYYLSSQLKFELNNTNKSMQELTEEYNFPNQSYFSRYYRRIIGETPTETRKNKRNNSFTIF